MVPYLFLNILKSLLEIHGLDKLTKDSAMNKIRSLTRTQRKILNVLFDKPRTIDEMRKELRKTQSTINYHLIKLSKEGLIAINYRERKKEFEISPEYLKYIDILLLSD